MWILCVVGLMNIQSHASFVCGTWLIHVCRTWLIQVCGTWLIHEWVMHHLYADMCGGTHGGTHEWVMSRVMMHDLYTWLIHGTHEHTSHASFVCGTWLIHVHESRHTYPLNESWHDRIQMMHDLWVMTWLIHVHECIICESRYTYPTDMCGGSHVCVREREREKARELPIWMWIQMMHGTWLIHVHESRHTYPTCGNQS